MRLWHECSSINPLFTPFHLRGAHADDVGLFTMFAKCFSAPVTWTSPRTFAFRADGHLAHDQCFLSQIKSQQDYLLSIKHIAPHVGGK